MSQPLSDKTRTLIRSGVDYAGPLAFLIGYLITHNMLSATWALVGASAIALAVGYGVERRIVFSVRGGLERSHLAHPTGIDLDLVPDARIADPVPSLFPDPTPANDETYSNRHSNGQKFSRRLRTFCPLSLNRRRQTLW